jgi:hypothetical protein
MADGGLSRLIVSKRTFGVILTSSGVAKLFACRRDAAR